MRLIQIYYIAPEVFRNKYNEKCDIWSCGIILFTMLCGHPPFRGSREQNIKEKILNGEFDFSEREWRKVSTEAKLFVRQLLTYNKDNRIDAETALSNDWLTKIRKCDESDYILDSGIVSNLVKFSVTI